MFDNAKPTFTAFAGAPRVDSGGFAVVAAAIKRAIDAGESREILGFEDSSARTVEIDFRGAPPNVQASARGTAAPTGEEPQEGPGRPKLGVVAQEVTLLPPSPNWPASRAALRRRCPASSKRPPKT
jgi:hypothetical protein